MPPHFAIKGDACYYVPGTGDRKWIPLGSDKARALTRWAELEGRTNNGTFGDLFRWFMAQAKLAPNTRKNYEAQGNAILRVFGNAPPGSIITPMLERYKDECPPGCANARISIIKAVFSEAVRKGLCKDNPARDVKRLKRVIRGRLITDAEYAAIRSRAHDFCQIAMDIAYQIGCRPGDVLRLRLADVSDAGVLLKAQKTGKQTLYQMTPDLASTLTEARALPRGVKGLYVLCNWRGQPYTVPQLRRAWDAACKAAGVSGAQFRDIRAKTASDDPSGAQKRLQHTDERMTQGYIRSVPVVMPIKRKI